MYPSGTVTFLFTDIEGSTSLWDEHPEEMAGALAWHDRLVGQVITDHEGHVFKTVGDAFCAVFSSAASAIDASVAIQRSLSHEQPETIPLKVRIGLHAGVAEQRAADYFGPTVNRVARIMSAGHGGQILLSAPVRELAGRHDSVAFRSLGDRKLKGIDQPMELFQLIAEGLEAEFPELSTLEYRPNNLPTQVTSFIGRETQLNEMAEIMESSRLLTIVGPGGTGKTRTSIESAARQLEAFPDGVWFADLASVSSDNVSEVAHCLSSAMGIRADSAQVLETLVQILREERALILLDNCEHVINGSAELASRLQSGCRQVSILCTSRQPLRVTGENVYPMPPLDLPEARDETGQFAAPAQNAAVRLFAERARLVSRDFVLTDTNADAIADICRMVDGLPLAIELAASRIKSLGVGGIRRKLRDRLSLLSRGSRFAPVRQQALRSLVDWSYELLSDQERSLFARLAVFPTSFSLDQVEVICGGVDELPVDRPPAWLSILCRTDGETRPEDRFEADIEGSSGIEIDDGVYLLLEQLVEKSLVTMSYRDDRVRYDMLATIRAYAEEKLIGHPEREQTMERYTQYFLLFVEKAETRSSSHDSPAWQEWLTEEYEQLRVAFERSWGLHHGASFAARIAASMFFASSISEAVGERSYEVGVLVGRCRERLDELDDALLKARLLLAATMGAYSSGNLAGLPELIQDSVRFAAQSGCPGVEILARTIAASLQMMASGVDPSVFDALFEFFSEERAPAVNRLFRRLLGTLLMMANDLDEAERQYERSLLASRDSIGRASAHLSMAWVLCRKEDYEGMRQHCLEGIALHAQFFHPDLVVLHTELIRALFQLSRFDEMKKSVDYLDNLAPMASPLITQVIHEALALWSIHTENDRETLMHLKEAIRCSFNSPSRPVEPLLRTAALLLGRGQAEEAALITQCVNAQTDAPSPELPPIPSTIAVMEQTLRRWREGTSQTEQEAVRTKAAQLSWDDAVQLTLRIIDRELVAREGGE